MSHSQHFAIALAVAMQFALAGCGSDDAASDPAARGAASADGQQHAHHHEAPHGGQIIELGIATHHAELVHDDATHTVGVYLLDGAAREAAAIEAESITINSSVGDSPVQDRLPAMPRPDDPAGSSSYFELVSETLCHTLDTPEATARLSFEIDGQPVAGDIATGAHGHGHDEPHDHDHGEPHGDGAS